MKLTCKKVNKLILIVLFAVYFFTSCSGYNSSDSADISFTNDSGLELSIGVKKSVVERAFHCSFENDIYYPLGEQYQCVLGFVDDRLAYAAFGSPWKVSMGPQCNDKMKDVIDYFGEPEGGAWDENRTVFYNPTYLFGNTRVIYSGTDGKTIESVICVDDNADISKIEASQSEYYHAILDEQYSQMPIIACHGYDERMNLPDAELMREIMGTPYIELDIGTDKLLYEELFGQSFENEKYYRISDPECILYFESGKLALFGIGESWYWGDGQLPKVECGQLMTDALKAYNNPIAQESTVNGDISELVFELKNGQRIGYQAFPNGKQIQFVYVIDASTGINSFPEI